MPEGGKFLKGLAVLDDVAYFGISTWAPRQIRDSPDQNCQIAAFDLIEGRLLWRRDVQTAGLLNVISAPHLGADAPYRAVYTAEKMLESGFGAAGIGGMVAPGGFGTVMRHGGSASVAVEEVLSQHAATGYAPLVSRVGVDLQLWWN